MWKAEQNAKKYKTWYFCSPGPAPKMREYLFIFREMHEYMFEYTIDLCDHGESLQTHTQI